MSNEKKNDGGPAFPTTERVEWHEDLGQGKPGYREYMATGGMTLRDYFAAKAMQAMVSAEFQMVGCVAYIDRNGGRLEDHVSACAYEVADAMLKAREA